MGEESKDDWLKVKEKIMNTWSNLSEKEIEETRGNLSNLLQLILDKNNEEKQCVVRKLVSLVHLEDKPYFMDSSPISHP